ncbi:MAG: D-isomer specific 2-hydroxyacid dehydrogenase family protein [Egibacteraceae bacterium]
MTVSRVQAHVAPQGHREWISDAVRAGGAQIVEAAEAEALFYTHPNDPDGLRELLDANPGIAWVQLPWAGIEGYVEAGLLGQSRLWTSGKGLYSKPVAEHALSLALAGLHGLKRYSLARSWGDQDGISLMDGRVTIFGAGGIAQELIRLLRPFECAITVIRRSPAPMSGVEAVLSFDERYRGLKDADVVFLALPLLPETRGLIGEVEFELMAPHAWLVNVARGPHVLTEDLLIALREDAIGGGALDVTDPEPLPEGHPLWSLPNCLITPHTANTEAMAIPLLRDRIIENLRRYARGDDLLGRVEPSLGY